MGYGNKRKSAVCTVCSKRLHKLDQHMADKHKFIVYKELMERFKAEAVEE